MSKRNPRRQPAYLRWLRAAQRDRGAAYKAWQIAESDRRRAIEAAPFNSRHAVAVWQAFGVAA